MNEIPEWAIDLASRTIGSTCDCAFYNTLRDKVARALVEQMEADCRAVCEFCAAEWELTIIRGGTRGHKPPYAGGSKERCRAAKIRAAAEATRPGEGGGE